jgi:hypothetical protein
MAGRNIPLDQVRIGTPCPVPWEAMHGDDKARFCTHCNRHVHNLSAMREDEAQRLICESAGRLCIAYVPNEQGGVTPLSYFQQHRPRYAWRLVAALAAMGGVASACVTAIVRPKPPPAAAVVPMLRGDAVVPGMMAPPMPQPAPATQPVICE